LQRVFHQKLEPPFSPILFSILLNFVLKNSTLILFKRFY
jgi:hypothetical protein